MNTQTPDATAELLLQVSQLNAWYGEAHILFDVGLEVRRGEVVALMGRNGAGKSTTLKAIMGLVERRKGSVQFMGQNIAQADSWRIARLGLGYVPEERRIFSGLTVLENLEVGRQPARRWADGSQASAWTVDELLAFFPNLAAMPQRPGGQMSGGEQQMLTVARTLMGNPYMVLLDEPSEGVAPVIVEQMAQMILQLKQRGVSILLCEQNLHFARLVSDRAYVLEKGTIQFAGSMQALIDEERAGAKRIGV
ncbi:MULTISPECIES: ABC transporter ATP-binding protein [unclassified Comamonas]|jgi:branched-chain amino acid transport system ATP-binding protein|uniref:ABC transporter ATP-binding protein n=1 Tax=unclassified Comamonas TaxID=2638500 RepID=UPI001EFA900B|nr:MULTISPECIES: ABC transporter ATP-binding protein [unclassified Comamonas]ULR90497.1 ABC transporter ATP-binding protein [Comamonas sp. B21-038]